MISNETTGHVQRMEEDRLLKQVTELVLMGKRRNVRPKTTWKMEIQKLP